jgi:tetratricopeptide (TPR) repeat protein
MLPSPMRRALLLSPLIVLLSSGACSKPALEPTVLTETRELDAEVLQLVERKVAAVRAAPSDARTHADLGLVYEANGLWDASEQSFAKALQLDGSQTIWLYHRALALREGGQSEPALAALREAAQKLPNSPAVQQRLGQWLLDRGDAAGAQAAFEQALKRAPDQPEFLTGLAGVELSRERWSEAFSLAKRALKNSPGYAQAHFVAGQALQGLGRADEAKAQLAAGVNAVPTWFRDELTTDYLAYRLTTSALAEDATREKTSGNFAHAVDLYEKLVLRKPDDADLLNNLGASLIELGRLDRADEVLARALALAPQAFAVHFNLCELHIKRKQLPEARAAAEKAVELGGGVGRTHFELARVLMMQKDTAGAYRELKTAAELDARNADVFLALTDAAGRLGRIEEARGWCRKGLELAPNSVAGHGMQGMLAFQSGDLELARSELALLEKLAPQDQRTTMLRNALQPGPH